MDIFWKKSKTSSDNTEDTSEIVYKAWKEEWEGLSDKEGRDYFYDRFNEMYGEILDKHDKNRKANFKYKIIFLVVFSLPPTIAFLCELIGLIGITGSRCVISGEFKLFPLIVSMLVSGFLASVVAKWIDIKKYQETWVRHEYCKYRIEREMLKFISNQEEYHKKNKKDIFMKNIWKISDLNQKTFIRNMTEREVGLYNILNLRVKR